MDFDIERHQDQETNTDSHFLFNFCPVSLNVWTAPILLTSFRVCQYIRHPNIFRSCWSAHFLYFILMNAHSSHNLNSFCEITLSVFVSHLAPIVHKHNSIPFTSNLHTQLCFSRMFLLLLSCLEMINERVLLFRSLSYDYLLSKWMHCNALTHKYSVYSHISRYSLSKLEPVLNCGIWKWPSNGQRNKPNKL